MTRGNQRDNDRAKALKKAGNSKNKNSQTGTEFAKSKDDAAAIMREKQRKADEKKAAEAAAGGKKNNTPQSFGPTRQSVSSPYAFFATARNRQTTELHRKVYYE